MAAHVKCSKCDATLSVSLEPVDEPFEVEWRDCENIIPKGRYWLAHDLTPDTINGHLVIHLDDRVGLSSHPDHRRHNGCCGDDGCDGANQVCTCGSEVATEVADCWTSYYLHFEPRLTSLVNDGD